MRSVILLSAEPLNLAGLASVYSDLGSVDLQSSERVVVEGEWGWFGIEIEERLAEEFCESELLLVREMVASPVFSSLEYSSSKAADLAVERLPSPLWVDNDHGMICPIEEIKMRIQQGLEWQSSPA